MVIQNAALTEHKYLQQIYDLFSEFVSESHEGGAEYPGALPSTISEWICEHPSSSHLLCCWFKVGHLQLPSFKLYCSRSYEPSTSN